MKKLSMVLLAMLLLFVFAGCSAEKETAKPENKETKTETTSTDTAKALSTEPIEPTHEDVCHFCNMKIYTKEDKMGEFTAQAIKEDGTHVFFDDSGCLLNASRKYNEDYTKKWVRDYATSEWIEADQAVVVKADIETPMKYGYAFFVNEENATTYINENKTNGVISTWDAIDQEANTRYQEKMKKEADMNSDETMDMDMKK